MRRSNTIVYRREKEEKSKDLHSQSRALDTHPTHPWYLFFFSGADAFELRKRGLHRRLSLSTES